MDGDDWCGLAVRTDASREMKVRKAVITAAGRGTRQYPASSTVQKEMFPLVDVDGLTKPTIQIIAEEALDLLPDAMLRVLPGTGYLMAYDDPVGVAREIVAFCG